MPSNDLQAAIALWERLGFARASGTDDYVIMEGWDCEVHLTQAGGSVWHVPAESNPFGVFIRTPDVDDIAARIDDLIIRPAAFCATVSGACTKSRLQNQTAFSSVLADHQS